MFPNSVGIYIYHNGFSVWERTRTREQGKKKTAPLGRLTKVQKKNTLY